MNGPISAVLRGPGKRGDYGKKGADDREHHENDKKPAEVCKIQLPFRRLLFPCRQIGLSDRLLNL